MQRFFLLALCLAAAAGAAWLGQGASHGPTSPAPWTEVLPGVWRSAGLPAGYALREGEAALLIDAPADAAGLQAAGVKKIDSVLLTHHHYDTLAAAGSFLAAGTPVRAPRASAEWLTPEGVAKYWQESIPLRNSRTAYLVLPEGLRGVAYDLDDGQTIPWHGWTVQVVATPGHSRDHVAYAVRRGAAGPLWVFCGDALAGTGKLWTPFTTDWDHWTDAGLKPAGQSLRKLAALHPAALLPAHGSVISKQADEALAKTAAAVEDLAFLKSFERFTKERLGHAPTYRFLAKDQVATSGEKPWTQVSEHLFLTGNTYMLTSRDNAYLVVDPWGKRSADQVARLVAERHFGPLEVVMFSHAHFDHYDGIYELPKREAFQVWTLAAVATPIADPALLRAPFLDARPVRIDRRLRDGESATWREYRFRFHHLPGQTEFTMGVETEIDGKRYYFTADNFFHQDQFSGTGGWMGLNRSFPLPYGASAAQVLQAAPEWVLAEHGGPFEFSAEDFRRRVQWGQVSAAAADRISPSGNHRRDWDPSRVTVEPLLQKARPGQALEATLVIQNPTARPEHLEVRLEGRKLLIDQTWSLDIPAQNRLRRPLRLQLPPTIPTGRQIFRLTISSANGPESPDAFLALDIHP